MNGTYIKKKKLSRLREQGRASLRGKWAIAILAMIISFLLGAQLATTSADSSGFLFNFILETDSDVTVPESEDLPDMTLGELLALLGIEGGEIGGEIADGEQDWINDVPISELDTVLTEDDFAAIGMSILVVLGIILLGALIGVVLSLAYSLFIGVPVRIGHLRFRLSLIDNAPGKIGTLFGGFDRGYMRYIGLALLKMVYVWLWSIPSTIFMLISAGGVAVSLFNVLLALGTTDFTYDWTALIVTALAMVFMLAFLVLPVIARYRYAMSDYVMAENPDMTVGDALRESTRMMKGNKWRLFCLQLSFIGWALLGILSLGIGFIWISPYMYQAEAAFYHEVSGREAIHEAVADMKELMAEL